VATLEELATYAERVGKLVETLGTYDHGGKQPFSYGAGVAHVTVDPKSGRVAVLDYVAVEDVGRVINPLIAHGQVIGGIVQGLGGVLMEHLLFDKAGQFLTGSLADYRLPTASDFPNVRSICLEECPAPGNPLGAKGVGEGGIGPVAAVIGNAVAAALAPLNASIRDLPLSPPRVWQMIRESQPL
jgi:carbon-monoxide dehydrogenase large subunit